MTAGKCLVANGGVPPARHLLVQGPIHKLCFYNNFLQIGLSSWSESHLLEAIANYTHVPCREDVQQNEHFGGSFLHFVPPTISPMDIFQQARLKSSSSDFSKSFGSAQSCETLLYMFWSIRKQNTKTNTLWITLKIPEDTLSILLPTKIFSFHSIPTTAFTGQHSMAFLDLLGYQSTDH